MMRFTNVLLMIGIIVEIRGDCPGGDTNPSIRPTSPTVCDSQNQGCCNCANGAKTTYVWWDTNNVQRCMHVFVPNSVTSSAPVIITSSGYGACNPGGIGGEWMNRANHYGFSIVDMCSLATDGVGEFGLQFGGDWIATTSNPVSCDSRDMDYLTTMFDFVETHANMDHTQVYTYGFSQNSMFALYTTACFSSKVRGIFQGGSGLSKQAYTPVNPGFQGFCTETSYNEHGSDCCEDAYCSECEYWPVYPDFGGDTIVDCIMSYVVCSQVCVPEKIT